MHWIRLHGPWLAIGSAGLPVTVKVPGQWSASDLANQLAGQDAAAEATEKETSPMDRDHVGKLLRLERKFNRPTGLSPEQRCWMVCWVEGEVAEVRLNEGVLARSTDELPTSEFRGAPSHVQATAYCFYPADLLAFNTLTLSLSRESQPLIHVHQVALGLPE